MPSKKPLHQLTEAPLTRAEIEKLSLPRVFTNQSEWHDSPVAFLDLETLGLDPWLGYRAWEAAIIVRNPDGSWVEKTFIIPHDLDAPRDPVAMDISGYKARYKIGKIPAERDAAQAVIRDKREKILRELRELWRGAIVYAANDKFDYSHLKFLFAEAGLHDFGCRFQDIATLAAPYLAGGGSLRGQSLLNTALKLGILPIKDGKHEAMPDTRVARDIFLVIEQIQIIEKTRLKREREKPSARTRPADSPAAQVRASADTAAPSDPRPEPAASSVSPFDLPSADRPSGDAEPSRDNWLADEVARAKAAWDANYAEAVRQGERTVDDALNALRPWIVEQLKARGTSDVKASAQAEAVVREVRKAAS